MKDRLCSLPPNPCTAEMLMVHRDTVIRAARTLDPGIVDLELNRVKIHGVPHERYVDRGDLGMLLEVVEAGE